MDADTLTQESGPGWRELIESLHEQIQAGREREAVLLRLLEMDRQALLHLSRTGRPRPASPGVRGEPSPLHSQIMEALASQPAGLTRVQLEDNVGSGQPLADVLQGLCRRGHLRRVGKGVYALPQSPGTTQEERNRYGHTHR
jgi:hypothetical protein